jgi:hypothetical protein
VPESGAGDLPEVLSADWIGDYIFHTKLKGFPLEQKHIATFRLT